MVGSFLNMDQMIRSGVVPALVADGTTIFQVGETAVGGVALEGPAACSPASRSR